MSPRTSRTAFAASMALAASAFSTAVSAYCPCYSPSSASNQYGCGVDPHNGQDPSNAEWNTIFDLVSQGPSVWGNQGPSVSDIGQGCGKPEALHTVPARFPCELLKGIAQQESGWRQFCVPDTPGDEVGGPSRTIISFDCGYGVGQVTSGMHQGENPGFDRARVAAEPAYNLATGTQILAGKWIATECVGDNQPAIIEDWYTAAWAYNGLSYVNNPNNPNYDPNRGSWDPAVGGGAPYQEKVFGWIEHPQGQWTPTALAYPNPGDVGDSGAPPALPEPDCASPTDCGNHRNVHETACGGTTGSGGGSSTSGAGGSPPASSGATSGAGGAASTGAAGVGGGASSGGGAGGGDNADGSPLHGSCSCRASGAASEEGGLGLLIAALALSGRRRRKAYP